MKSIMYDINKIYAHNFLLLFFHSILQEKEMSNYPGVEEFCMNLYDKDIRSPYLMGFMVELDEEKISQGEDVAKRLEHAKLVSVWAVMRFMVGWLCNEL